MNRPDGPAASADEPVDVEAIMLSLRAEILRRRSDAEAHGIDFDATDRRLPRPVRLPPTLHDAVFEAQVQANATTPPIAVPTSRLPIVGRLVDRLRARAHRLARSHVDFAMRRQAAFNAPVAAALSQLVAALEAEEAERRARVAEIADLRREIERLQQRIAALEQRG
jgi:hypothetical protein